MRWGGGGVEGWGVSECRGGGALSELCLISGSDSYHSSRCQLVACFISPLLEGDLTWRGLEVFFDLI